MYCSLARYEPQEIPSGPYTLLTFPDVSSDELSMGQGAQGLILPAAAGTGILELNIHWAAGDYTELRDVFVRDPYGSTGNASLTDNRTGYDHRPPSPGIQCFDKLHMIKVEPGVPLGVYVSQNSGGTVSVTHAQFKLKILP